MKEDGNELAQKIYIQIREENPNLRTKAFLRLFKSLTEDQRPLIPENYPLTQKDFQIKLMYEQYGWDKAFTREPLSNKTME